MTKIKEALVIISTLIIACVITFIVYTQHYSVFVCPGCTQECNIGKCNCMDYGYACPCGCMG